MEVLSKSISEDKPYDLESLLKNAPIEKLDSGKQILFFKKLLEVAEKNHASERVLVVLLERFYGVFKVETINQMVGYTAGLWIVNISTIQYMLIVLDLNLYNILEEMLDYDSVIYPMMVDRLMEAYGRDYHVTWDVLYDLSLEKKNRAAIPYLEEKVKETSPESKVPPWIIVPEETPEPDIYLNACTYSLGEWEGVNMSDVPVDDANILTRHILQKIEFDEEVPMELLEKVANIAISTTSGDPERKDQGLLADPDLVFGPLNANCKGRECITGIPGGCRMLSCNCHQIGNEGADSIELLNENDWFEGNCDTCKNTINDISHTIRYPVEGGGYMGCFCGVKCMLDNPPLDFGMISQLLVSRMMEILKTKRVVDRSKINLPDEIREEVYIPQIIDKVKPELGIPPDIF